MKAAPSGAATSARHPSAERAAPAAAHVGRAATGAFKALLAHTSGPAPRLPTPRLPAPRLPAQPDAARSKPAHGAPKGAPPAGEREAEPGPQPPRPERRSERREEDRLDPAARQAAHMAPPMPLAGPEATGATAPEVKARASLEELLPGVVKRIAWAGDGRKGTVRMELGAGPLAGATVVVHADGGRVRVEVVTPAGVDAAEWRQRLEARLVAQGLDVEQLEVT